MDILSEFFFFFMVPYIVINIILVALSSFIFIYDNYTFYFIVIVFSILYLSHFIFNINIYKVYLSICYVLLSALAYSLLFTPLYFIGALFTYNFDWSYYMLEVGGNFQSHYLQFLRYEYLDNYCGLLFMLSLPLILHYNGVSRKWRWLSRRYRRYYMRGALQAVKCGIIAHFIVMAVIAAIMFILYIFLHMVSLAEKLSEILPPFSWNPFLM